MRTTACTFAVLTMTVACGAHPHAAPNVTSLTNKDVTYERSSAPLVKLQRGPVTALVVDNSAIDASELPGHRAGYNGIAKLVHAQRPQNLFVPGIAGLNFEHIHDGTRKVDRERFEPRRFPMELRIVDPFTVEVYQPPTGNWKLESCGRYQILPDGVIEYTFECIPRAKNFSQGYIGLFWASYIHQPADRAIMFEGRDMRTDEVTWLRALSPEHGVDSTHPPAGRLPELNIDPEFSLTLVNHRSNYVYESPWYYGISHGMAYAQMFRRRDRIWFAQSPTGGGQTNPAWDFQWFVPDAEVGEAYGFVMRAAYVPWSHRKELEQVTLPHRTALNGD